MDRLIWSLRRDKLCCPNCMGGSKMKRIQRREAAIVGPYPARKRAGYRYEARLRGLNQPAKAGFVLVAGGFNRPAA